MDERITNRNLYLIVKKRQQPNLDIGKKSRLRIRADELDLETSKHCNFAVTGE